MHYINPQIVETIVEKSNSDILKIVEESIGDSLKKKGAGFWANSPFQEEKTPSFVVNPVKGTFKCFSTGIGGNAVKFLMELKRWNWLETLHHLAERFNIDVTPQMTDTERAQASRLSRLRELCEWAQGYFHSNLMDQGSHVWGYLEKRGYDLVTCKELGLGLALSGYDHLQKAAETAGFNSIDLIDSGLVAKNKSGKSYDVFRDRIIFPIHDDYGRPVGFAGRIYSDRKDSPKYINSPASPLYNKSEILYNLHEAREEIIKLDSVYITEGYTDTQALKLAGVKNVIATCGTALTPSHIKKIQRLTRNVILLRDADKAGKKATLRDIDSCLEGNTDPQVLSLPDGLDPDDYIGKFGVDKFKAEKPQEWFEYKTDHFSGDLSIPRIRNKLIQDIAQSLQKIASPVLRSETITTVSENLNIKVKDLELAVNENPFQLSKRLSWDHYLILCTQLGLSPSVDFEQGETGGVLVRYKDLNDNPVKKSINGQAVELTRDTKDGGETHYGIYVPNLLRMNTQEMAIETTGRLVVVQDEITADFLTQLNIPAVGISRPNGFQGGPGSSKPARLLAELIKKGFQRIIYILSGEAFSLPQVKSKAGKPDFIDTDAGKIAQIYVKSLSRLINVLPQNRSWVVYPDHRANEINTQSQRWVEDMLLNRVDLKTKLWNRIDHLDEDEENFIQADEITNFTQKGFEELMKIDTAQRFFDFHGEVLGESFKLDKGTYKVNLDGRVELLRDGIDPDVFLKDNRYYARLKGGYKPVTNFKLECDLRIMGKNAFGIYIVQNANTLQTRQIIIKNEDFQNAVKFSTRVSEIPKLGAFSQATSPQLAELFQLVCEGSNEATNLRTAMGWHELTSEIDEQEAEVRTAFWVFGNGILNGKWRPANQKGLVYLDGDTYFIPAMSTIQEDPENHSKTYERQRGFQYHESNFPFDEWIQEIHYVHGINGHKAFAFSVMAMYYDLILQKMGKAPLMHFEGPPGAGKDELRMSIASLWGDLKWMDLQTAKITPAGYAAFFQQYSNALNIVNEYNPSSVDPARLDPIKSTYEGKLGEKKAGPSTNQMDSGKVTSAVIIMGQEPNANRAAIFHRCIHCLFEERTYTEEQTMRLSKLKSRQQKGLGQIFKKLAIHRNLIDEKFEDKYNLIIRRIKAGIEHPTGNTERLVSNWAIMLSGMWILIEEGIIQYPYDYDFIIKNAIEEIERQDKSMIKNGLLEIFFFDFIQVHYMQNTKYRLHHQHIFHITDVDTYTFKDADGQTKTVPTPKGVIVLQTNNIHSIFASFLRDQGKKLENTSKTDLRRLLKKHPSFICQNGWEWIGYKMNEKGEIIETGRGPEKNRASVYVFDASVLNLSIEYTFSFDVDYTTPPVQVSGQNVEEKPVPF